MKKELLLPEIGAAALGKLTAPQVSEEEDPLLPLSKSCSVT